MVELEVHAHLRCDVVVVDEHRGTHCTPGLDVIEAITQWSYLLGFTQELEELRVDFLSVCKPVIFFIRHWLEEMLLSKNVFDFVLILEIDVIIQDLC